jgi:hypothetical protein
MPIKNGAQRMAPRQGRQIGQQNEMSSPHIQSMTKINSARQGRTTHSRTSPFSPLSQAEELLGTSVGHGILFIDGFLSEEECGQILEELEVAFWQPSLDLSKASGWKLSQPAYAVSGKWDRP